MSFSGFYGPIANCFRSTTEVSVGSNSLIVITHVIVSDFENFIGVLKLAKIFGEIGKELIENAKEKHKLLSAWIKEIEDQNGKGTVVLSS